jgi:alpha-glucuronidase
LADLKSISRRVLIAREDVDLEFDGKTICNAISSLHFSDAEKTALVENRWRIIHRTRTKRMHRQVIEREIEQAVVRVRRR